MAADPFNSAGGYTVGIPPIPILDANGNLTVNNANIGNVTINGDSIVTGTMSANLFVGNFTGNIVGNVVVPGQNTEVLYNDNGQAGSSSGFTFDQAQQLVAVSGRIATNSLTLGSGLNEFCTSTIVFATTQSAGADQVLHRSLVNTLSSVDYTIIATDVINNYRQTSKLFAGVLGTDVGYFEYGTIDVPQISPGVGDFKVTYIDGNVSLTVTPVVSTLVNYKIMITSYKE